MLKDAAPKMGRVDEVLNLDQGRRAVPGGDWIHWETTGSISSAGPLSGRAPLSGVRSSAHGLSSKLAPAFA
jgi:hypothetical protein